MPVLCRMYLPLPHLPGEGQTQSIIARPDHGYLSGDGASRRGSPQLPVLDMSISPAMITGSR